MNRVATGVNTIFKVKRTLKLRRMFKAYSDQEGIPLEKLRFLKDGSRLSVKGSVEEGGLLDCDEIDVFVDSTPSVVQRSKTYR